MTKKSKMTLALASMLGVTAGATAVSGFAWFATTKSASIDVTNIGVYSKSSGLNVALVANSCVGCQTTSGDDTINLVGATAASPVTETQDTGENAEKTTFTLTQYPSATPTVKIGNDDYAGTVQLSGKTVTLGTAPGADKKVSFTYTPYAALTDTSSIDGQHIYKPVWTASGEGRYATEITHNGGVGYVQFAITITASGNADLEIYLDRPSIDPVTNASPDTDAAAITRVAFVEDKDVDETLLILQNDISSNKRGIKKSLVDAGPNYDSDDEDNVNDLYDVNGLTDAVSSAYFAAPDKTNVKANENASWGTAEARKTKANNWLCKLNAAETKTIIVTIWLEGTSGNTDAHDYGAFAESHSPENGMIKVNLPLVAF